MLDEFCRQRRHTKAHPVPRVHRYTITAVIAALQVLDGKPTPKDWVLPQPVITKSNLSQYVTPGMPPLFYVMCGCQKMAGFPKDWQQ